MNKCKELVGGHMVNYTVPQILQLLSQSKDEELTIKYENILSYLFAVPILIIGGTANCVVLCIIGDNPLKTTFINTSFLYFLAFVFWLMLNVMTNERRKSHLYTFLFVCIFTFVVIRFYLWIGPAVWSLSLVLLMISILHTNKSMLIAIVLNVILMGIYVFINQYDFTMTPIYYGAQAVSFFVVFIIAAAVHTIIRDRFKTITGQYNKLFDSEKKLHSTLTSVGDGVITVDRDGYIEFMNTAAIELTGFELKDVIGKPFEAVYNTVDEDSRIALDSPFSQAFMGECGQEWEGESILINKDGQELFIYYTVSLIRNSEDRTIGGVIVFKDFTDENEEKKKIEFLSYHDQLTGLYNRRFFEEEFSRLDTKRNLPLSIIYADVNGLKTFNDGFGHEYGDDLIKKMADIFRAECRSEEIIARIGGDEFVILLPKTNEDYARAMLTRIAEAVESNELMGIQLSLALGHATKVSEKESLKTTLKIAENHMYQMKKSYASKYSRKS